MSRASREKGKRGEQEVVQLLRPLYPDARSKRAGGESATVDRGRDVLGTPGLCIQVKDRAQPSPLRALDEARAVALRNEMPVAFVKESWTGLNQHSEAGGRGWCVVMLADDFVRIFGSAKIGQIARSK